MHKTQKGFTPLEITGGASKQSGNHKFLTGFTLLEVIVVIGVLAILIVFLLGIVIANSRFYSNQSGEIGAISSTREISNRITEYTRAAVMALATTTYSSILYTADSDTLILQVPSIDASFNIISATYDNVIITRDTGNSSRLVLVVDPNASSARKSRDLELTSNLASTTFTYIPASPPSTDRVDYLIKVIMGGSSPASEYIEGSVTLRNK